jgi:beta-glucosidase
VAWESKAGKECSGQASRHYELYEQDFDLVKNLNHNAHRLSIEWSRIEPKEGEFFQKELQHYLNVISSLKARKIEPFVTLHHFTNPNWFSESGGWGDRRSVDRFLRYCDFVTRALARHVHYWITINEPTIYISHSYLLGLWPPQLKSFWKAKPIYDNMTAAHVQVYRRINSIYKELGLSKPAISIAHHMSAMVPCIPNLRNRVAASLRDYCFNFKILDRLVRHKTLDFIGFNYYSRQLIDVQGWRLTNLMGDLCYNNHHPVKKNSLGWDIYPDGIRQVLLKLKKYNLPVIITENGICTSDDNLRWEFLSEHLKSIHAAMEQGVDVQGYLYWALMDNFEWAEGFGPRFGLIDINYKTFERTVRDSARKYDKVCQTGLLE